MCICFHHVTVYVFSLSKLVLDSCAICIAIGCQAAISNDLNKEIICKGGGFQHPQWFREGSISVGTWGPVIMPLYNSVLGYDCWHCKVGMGKKLRVFQPCSSDCHSLRNFLMGCRRNGFVAVIIYLYLYCIRSGQGPKLTLAKHQMRVDDLFGK